MREFFLLGVRVPYSLILFAVSFRSERWKPWVRCYVTSRGQPRRGS